MKLRDEIEDFLKLYKYDISCRQVEEEKENNVKIKNYDDFMKCRQYIDKWIISDECGNAVANEIFQCNLERELNKRIKKVIEQDYFANYLEKKWEDIRREMEKKRSDGSIFELEHKQEFLEFFVIQYLRVNTFIENVISPSVGIVKEFIKLSGYEDDELDEDRKNDGVLDVYTYFYGILLDAARGKKEKILKYMKSIEESYVLDLLHSKGDIGYITSTSPCTEVAKCGDFKTEMLFPISYRCCIKFTAKALVGGRSGRYFEQEKEEVKIINRKIIKGAPDIVISEAEYIIDRI